MGLLSLGSRAFARGSSELLLLRRLFDLSDSRRQVVGVGHIVHENLIDLLVGDRILNELARRDLFRHTTWHLDALLDQPLLEDARA